MVGMEWKQKGFGLVFRVVPGRFRLGKLDVVPSRGWPFSACFPSSGSPSFLVSVGKGNAFPITHATIAGVEMRGYYLDEW
jgi:hypothetical protein